MKYSAVREEMASPVFYNPYWMHFMLVPVLKKLKN